MKTMASRQIYLVSFIIIVILLTMSVFLQKYKGVIPCPLCITQRYVLSLLGVLFFIGILFNPQKMGQVFLSLLSFIVTILGMLVAGRQVWLQHFPQDGFGDCGASLDYMLKVLPITDVVKKIWEGGTECSQLGWQFFHLSLAEWSFIWFLIFAIITVVLLKRALYK